MTITARIAAAFPISPIPPEPLVEPSYLEAEAQGDEGATAHFSGKSWPELDGSGLAYHRAAMYMFTPTVHAYYLPAFMMACIEHSDGAGSITEDLLLHLASYREPFWNARVSTLSQEQRNVVSEFVAAIGDEFNQGSVRRAAAGLRASAKGNV